MNPKLPRSILLFWSTSSLALVAAPIQNLKFTDVVKDVMVLNVATKKETPAKVGDVLSPPNVIKTGVDSRAELVAEDNTVTRVGANTIFSVEPNSRDVNIGKGSVMFHSPTGKGGGNIKSAGATASVLGTTLIVGANQQGGFKVMLLEGKGQVSGASGGAVKLNAGQMSFAMPGQAPSQPLNFELKGQVSGSKLVGGFSKPIASIAKIEAAIATQQAQISGGQLANTGLLIGDSPTSAFKVDTSVIQNVIRSITLNREKIDNPPPRDKFQELDPRYAQALAKDLSLTSPTPDPEIPNPGFTIDINTGKGEEYATPLTVPGARFTVKITKEKDGGGFETLFETLSGGVVSFLFSRNINVNLGLVADRYVLPVPFENKNFYGLVALNNISIDSSVQILHPDGDVVKPFLLSAGNTLSLAQDANLTVGFLGTPTVGDSIVPTFDIYTSGYPYSDVLSKDAFLTEQQPPAGTLKTALNITGGGQRIENATVGGWLRISSPAMWLQNVDLLADAKLELTARDADVSFVDPNTSLAAPRTSLKIGDESLANLSTEAQEDPDSIEAQQLGARPNLLAAEVILQAKGSLQLLGAIVSSDSVTLSSESELVGDNTEAIRIKGTTFRPRITENLAVYAVDISASAGGVRIENSFFDGQAHLVINSKRIDVSASDFRTAGSVTLKADQIAVANTILPESISFDLPIGFNSPTGLTVGRSLVSIQSKGRALRFSGVFMQPTDPSLSNAEQTPQADLKLSSIQSVLGDRAALPTYVPDSESSISIIAKEGALQILGQSDAGEINGTENIPLNVIINAEKQYVLLNNLAISDVDSFTVSAEKDVTFKDVSVSSSRAGSKVVISSNSGNVLLDGNAGNPSKTAHVLVDGKKVIQSKTVTIVSKVKLDSDGVPSSVFTSSDVLVDGKSVGNIEINNHTIKAETVHMAAQNYLKIFNSNFVKMNEAQVLNLVANTTVLKNVNFADGSVLNFKVGGDNSGNVVASNVGTRTQTSPGLLNIMDGVNYGNRQIKFESPDSMNGTEFRNKLHTEWVGKQLWDSAKEIPIYVKQR